MTAPVLIVTSDNEIAFLLGAVASVHGYQSLACSANVIPVATRQRIGLILLDTPIPTINLKRLVQQLRSAIPDAPIVLCSTNEDERFIADELMLDGFLYKPFDIAEIAAWLGYLVEPRERMVGV